MLRKLLSVSLLVGAFGLVFGVTDLEARHCYRHHYRHHCCSSNSGYGNYGYNRGGCGQTGYGQCGNQQGGSYGCQPANAYAEIANCCHQQGAATAVVPAPTPAPRPSAAQTSALVPGTE